MINFNSVPVIIYLVISISLITSCGGGGAADSGNTDDNNTNISTSNVSWKNVTPAKSVGAVAQKFESVATNGDIFVALEAVDPSQVYVSLDGTSWSAIALPPNSIQGCNGSPGEVLWSGSEFQLFIPDGKGTSFDGINWSFRPFRTCGNGGAVANHTILENELYFLDFSGYNRLYLASGGDGYCVTEYNIGQMVAYAENNNVVVGVSADGYIYRSSNFKATPIDPYPNSSGAFYPDSPNANKECPGVPTNWTNYRPAIIAENFLYRNLARDMIWTGEMYVLLTYTNVFTSPDGIEWTEKLQTELGLNAMSWNGTELVVVGDKGSIISSRDTVSWTVENSLVTVHLIDIAWNGSHFVAIGGIPDPVKGYVSAIITR